MLPKQNQLKKRKAYLNTLNHCAGCNLNGRSDRMRHSCPIPIPCYINLPYESPHNTRICQGCYKCHYNRKKNIFQAQDQQIQPPIIRIAPHHRNKLTISSIATNNTTINNTATTNNNNQTNAAIPSSLQMLIDASTSASVFTSAVATIPTIPVTTSSIANDKSSKTLTLSNHQQVIQQQSRLLKNLHYQGDIYDLFSTNHLDYINKLETKYKNLSYPLQTSVVSGCIDTNEIAGSKSSSTNAEITQKSVLKILLYLIYFIPPQYRLHIYSDTLIDIGSGHGHILLLAYAGLGVESVVGVELVPSRAIESINYLSRTFNYFQFDCTRGYRRLYPIDTDGFIKHLGGKTRAQIKQLSSTEQPQYDNYNNNNANDNIAQNNSSNKDNVISNNYYNTNGTHGNDQDSRLLLHPFSEAGNILENLLPPGLKIYSGDIIDYAKNSNCEVYQRFHSSSHLSLFDLAFSAASLQSLAALLSAPVIGFTRWRVLLSMHSPYSWNKFGLTGWSTMGKMDNINFRCGVQSATVYFYCKDSLDYDNNNSTSTPSTLIGSAVNSCQKISPSAMVQRQLDLLSKQNK